MKWLLGMLAILLAGTGACAVRAGELPAAASVHGDFAATRPDIFLVTPFALSASEPQSKQPSDDEHDLRWQLGLGFVAQRFRSKPFSVTLYGVQTSITYFVNDRFGIEGNIAGNCRCDGVTVNNEQASYVVFTGGGRVVWNRRKRALQPWVHALGGGAVAFPQTASGGTKAWAVQTGGGVDVRLSLSWSLRAQGDYVRTWFYSSTQNNFQFGAGVVAHF